VDTQPIRRLPWYLPTYLEAVMVLSFVTFLNPITSFDLWWHLACGREFLATGTVPAVDTLSIGSSGGAWTAFYWLWCVVAFSVVWLGGLPLLLTLKAACAALSTQLFARIARESGIRHPVAFLLTVILGIGFLFSQLWNLRAQMTSVVCVPMMTCLFLRYQRTGKIPWVRAPLLTCLWANCHAGFVLAIVIWGVFFAGSVTRWCAGLVEKDQPRRMMGLGVLMLLACCLTPYGPRLLAYPFWYLGNAELQTRITEWNGILIREYPLLELGLLLLVAVAVVVPFRSSLEQASLLVISLHFIYQAVRHMYLFGSFVAPAIGVRVQALLESSGVSPIQPGLGCSESGSAAGGAEDSAGRSSRKEDGSTGLKLILTPSDQSFEPLHDRTWMAWILILVISTGLLGGGYFRDPDHVLNTAVYPLAQLEFLKDQPQPGRLFNQFYLGGLVLFHLYPGTKPFVDGRVDVHMDSGAFKAYLACVDQAPGWQTVFFETHRFGWAFLERGSRLGQALERRGWVEFGPKSAGFSLLRAPPPVTQEAGGSRVDGPLTSHPNQ